MSSGEKFTDAPIQLVDTRPSKLVLKTNAFLFDQLGLKHDLALDLEMLSILIHIFKNLHKNQTL